MLDEFALAILLTPLLELPVGLEVSALMNAWAELFDVRS